MKQTVETLVKATDTLVWLASVEISWKYAMRVRYVCRTVDDVLRPFREVRDQKLAAIDPNDLVALKALEVELQEVLKETLDVPLEKLPKELFKAVKTWTAARIELLEWVFDLPTEY